MKPKGFSFEFKKDKTVRADMLVKQVVLPLHHHMAPGDEDDGKKLRG